MRTNLSGILHQPFYAWLVGIYPILHLYSENLGLVKDGEFLASVNFMLFATTIGFAVANAIIRNRHKSAIVLSVLSLVFSLSGHVYGLVFQEMSIVLWTTLVTFTLIAILAKLIRKDCRDFCAQVTPVFNLILLVPTLLMIAQTATRLNSISTLDLSILTSDAAQETQPQVPKTCDSPTRPDIYYIIPDGYPSDAWLRDEMNFDNSQFTRALEDRGFAIAPHAQCNYAATLHSLASILNMQHYGSNPSPWQDLAYLRLLIANSEVARQLKQLGYTYIQLQSGYLFPSPVADINRDFAPSGPIEIGFDPADISTKVFAKPTTGWEFSKISHSYKQSFVALYLDTTILRVFANHLNKLLFRDEYTPYGVFAPARFLDTVDDIANIVAMPEATFAVIHLIKPHGPVSFNEHGDTIGTISRPSHREFFAEFTFTNSKFLEMIDTILEGSRHEPIIIFQADHGSTYGIVGTKDDKLTHFDVYAAYYLPDPKEIRFHRPFTLINTFPLVLNAVFDMDLELQEDRLIEVLGGYGDPFKLRNVTKSFSHN